jgi:hypothetical protein
VQADVVVAARYGERIGGERPQPRGRPAGNPPKWTPCANTLTGDSAESTRRTGPSRAGHRARKYRPRPPAPSSVRTRSRRSRACRITRRG